MRNEQFDIHPEAEKELEAGVDFYEDAETGLGDEFFQDFVSTVFSVLKHNEIGHPYFSVRRHLFTEFPFGLVYRVKDKRIQIVAVAHFRRRPGYWKERIKDIPA